jgi:hypothetical protein
VVAHQRYDGGTGLCAHVRLGQGAACQGAACFHTRFSKESAGPFDLDAELRIWIRGDSTPIVKEFKKDNDVNAVYRLLSQAVLMK